MELIWKNDESKQKNHHENRIFQKEIGHKVRDVDVEAKPTPNSSLKDKARVLEWCLENPESWKTHKE